jgi:predicted acylesterase/phospholipase RssA
MDAQDEDNSTYEIGLVMAGAVSAGAYAAGVVDFLIQALDEWHRAKAERPGEVPDHEVRLNVVAGSSAGGMTGAIAAAILNGDHRPVTSLPGTRPDENVRQSNELYSAWVDQIGADPLLDDRDLSGPNATVRSLLDASILEDIAETAIDFDARDETRAYVADPMHLILTVTNLKGVPYDISFQGNQGVPHRTARHTDYKEFALSRTEPEASEALWLNARDSTAAGWEALREYALATGAFPGGLPPRPLRRERADYEHRAWKVPLRPEDASADRCWQQASITPSWDASVRDEDEYRFLAVDGGAMNNEPFELARRKLAGADGFNPRSPDAATRSVLMVDPFPSGPTIGRGTGAEDVLSVIQSLFGSLLTQARFKPDEVMLANSAEVYSRYMIVPTRRDQDGNKVEPAIASATLNGFGGFVKKDFRMHDFQLGRRNCQQFLRKHFGIPVAACADNPVFQHYSPDERARFSVETEAGEIMPIIPLVGSAQSEEHPLVWKTLQMNDRELIDLEQAVRERTRAVLNGMVDEYFDGWLLRKAGKLLARKKVGSISDRIMNTVEEELTSVDLKQSPQRHEQRL